MDDRTFWMSFLVGAGIIAALWAPNSRAEEISTRRAPRLEVLSFALKLNPEQVKQADRLMKADDAIKHPLRDRLRKSFARLDQAIRTQGTSDADIQAHVQEIASIQEELIFRDAKTQVALKKILNKQQVETFNRMAQLDSSIGGRGDADHQDYGAPCRICGTPRSSTNGN